MAPGQMTFPVYVRHMPPNMKFTVTEIKVVNPIGGGHWYAFHSCLQDVPFTVDPSESEGSVGEFILQCGGAWQSGPGPKFDIRFTIEGTAPNDVKASMAGRMVIETDDWGVLMRPRHGTISFCFDEGLPSCFGFTTPVLAPMEDCCIVVEWIEEKETIGMSITSDKAFAEPLAKYGAQGVLTGHAKAAEWAVGTAW
ncbi:hypothetical protein EDB81DRAFT_857115 [Dactylonectria macrodidyma]|uniref:Uncharacterized protein n=1 Tax=Dactylonectria macrodidyma TaxID=307937 RepID=A0A9P9ETG5_9HYPO|nr:hypothetical protein EDB81DRAFT_857115 [Dactylonectria macrodidyma]